MRHRRVQLLVAALVLVVLVILTAVTYPLFVWPATNPPGRVDALATLWTCLLVLTIVVALAAGTTTTTAIHAQNAAARRADAPVATAIRFALAHIGKPYRWGGTGPNSFDCSGLTMRAYQAGGIVIPRVSRDQYRAGRHVALSQLLPGDLVFYTHAEESKVPAGSGHVAMSPCTLATAA